ncbi:hypothetical protein SBY92_002299 [Candida maltosa Xu316]|uniref:Stationary phase protein n=1 Tax=Candida maltosa (strain Xu316) TaxID=1245528 RepID=M3IS95_CANMX|nr:hypothetical protein G210_5811 [Candida maltosa Xu316]
MNVQRLRNLISLRTRNFSQRLQRALQELAENLQREVQPAPVPVPVPVRNRNNPIGRRNYSTFYGSNYHPNWSFKNNSTWSKYNIFQKFYNTSGHSKILKSINRNGYLFHNFSQAYQNPFRTRLYQYNVKFTYRTLFNNLREKFQVFNQYNQEPLINKFNPTIKLNLSLTPAHHQLTLKLARTDSSATTQEKLQCNQVHVGCYIDFPINFNLNIPQETILSEEVLDEMLFNIKVFERKLEILKKDLASLFDLGELPIKYITGKNVLRIHFPNCDRQKLESLCREKGITGGFIFEEESPVDASSSEPISSSTSYGSDILSSYSDEQSNSTFSSDVLSEDLDAAVENDLVFIEPVSMPIQQNVDIYDDDFHWVSSN